MLVLPGTCVYLEKTRVSYIWGEVRLAQTLSSNHRKELPACAGTSRGAAEYVEYLVQSGKS